jgi:3-hydroxy-9,10-secoandrosta-1,3,5(10)-triene-9,17-dione monooxygenase reductase component
MSPEAFRRALGRFASGVALVTAPGGAALVVSAFMSVSLEPPLVAFAAGRSSTTWKRMRRADRYGVNVLPGWVDDVRWRALPGADRLAGLDVEVGDDGVPRLRDAVAFLRCEPVDARPAGDHEIVVCRVLETVCGTDTPLVAFAGALRALDM